jgi:hypothetical protein
LHQQIRRGFAQGHLDEVLVNLRFFTELNLGFRPNPARPGNTQNGDKNQEA